MFIIIAGQKIGKSGNEKQQGEEKTTKENHASKSKSNTGMISLACYHHQIPLVWDPWCHIESKLSIAMFHNLICYKPLFNAWEHIRLQQDPSISFFPQTNRTLNTLVLY